ncbi:hypothetical protein RRF57_008432 [Xylaria bambusicola]|uniref:Uncharacterized protein n=1 Tax=Xylaria bambusicola TaxID=326684 RepID=A0AAN7UTI9_9PEZI
MYSHRFFVHPQAQTQRKNGVATRRSQSSVGSSFVLDNSHHPAHPAPHSLGVRKMMADMKITLAVNQLSDQVKESMGFWRRFQDEYTREVDSIRFYIGVDVLQQIWQQKVEYYRKDKRVDEQEDHRFEIQSMKLESCLNQVDEATQLLAETQPPGYNRDYDSRQHHLAKMRATGASAINLSRKAVTKEAACIDLLEELAELEKLVDPKRATARVPSHFNKSSTQTTSGSEEGDVDRESNHQNINRQAESNSNNWAGEENTS